MHKYTFFSGKGGGWKNHPCGGHGRAHGGVGETDLIVSTDPASNLPTSSNARIGPRVREIAQNLFALEIDPDTATREYGERALAPLRSVLPPDAMKVLGGAVPERLARGDRPSFDRVQPISSRTRSSTTWSSTPRPRATRSGCSNFRSTGPAISRRPAQGTADVHRAGRLAAGGQGEVTTTPSPRSEHPTRRSSRWSAARSGPPWTSCSGAGKLRTRGIGNFRIVCERGDPGRGGRAVRGPVIVPTGAGPRLSGGSPTLHRGAAPGRGSEAFPPWGRFAAIAILTARRFPPRTDSRGPRPFTGSLPRTF